MYAWIITADHLFKPGDPPEQSEVGTIGPRNAPAEMVARLNAGEGDTFKMYDDDMILYYTGRGLSADGEWNDDACFGPIDDFGRPNAGALWIRWSNHPERDNG